MEPRFRANSEKPAKFPEFSPLAGNFARDWFAVDCAHHHSVRAFLPVANGLQKALCFPGLASLHVPTLGKKGQFSPVRRHFQASVSTGLVLVPSVWKGASSRWSADALRRGPATLIAGAMRRQVGQAGEAQRCQADWLGASEDAVDDGWREEGERQDAAHFRCLNTFGRGDVTDRLVLPIDEHGEISMSFEDELDETGIWLAMLVSRVGDHHPHLDAASSERDTDIRCWLLHHPDPALRRAVWDQRCDHRRSVNLDGEPTGFQGDASDELADELATGFDRICFEPGHQNAASIERCCEIRSGCKLLNPISELSAIVKDLSQLMLNN